MTNVDIAKFDPESIYKTPRALMEDKTLSRAEKIDILRRWAYDERERAVAEEENMIAPGDQDLNRLDEILSLLLTLGVNSDQEDPPPTKQG